VKDTDEFKSYFAPKGGKTGYLATVATRGRAAVRPVTFFLVGREVFFCTGAADAKIEQLKKNANVEVCIPVNRGRFRGYYRLTGEAEIIAAPRLRNKVLKHVPYPIENHWASADDPALALVRVNARAARYLAPGRSREKEVTL
jgi:uncharacterized pyridoxamine 5'-phosphate oxidase family protein